MNEALLPTLAVAVVAVVLAATATLVVAGARRRLERELATSRTDVDRLREQVQKLTQRIDAPGPPSGRSPGADERGESREFVITSLPDGSIGEVAVPDAPRVDAGRFASLAVSESVVRLVSLGHGVRRALSPESRNRIRFEMRQEVKRARRRRRRDLKAAKRHLRAQQPGGEPADLRSDAA